MKQILVFNAGSSSLKFKLFSLNDQNNLSIVKKGAIDRIGFGDGPKNHTDALSILFKDSLCKIENLAAIGHRVVYGGDEFRKIQLIDEEIITKLKKYNHLAPLHNQSIIAVMEQVYQISNANNRQRIPNYAIFDTEFYINLPQVSAIYPIPYRYHVENKIQRFGFHGISHKYAFEYAKKVSKNDFQTLISVHLGAGCSVTAIKNGIAIDTSMGYTPQEGLMMATRCGDIDTGIIIELMKQDGMSGDEVWKMLNSESGLLGISGISGDMKDLLWLANYQVEDQDYQPSLELNRLSEIDRKKAKLAIDMFVYRIKKYIGSYNAILGETDILIFTGKIGNGSSVIRNLITDGLENILAKTKIMRVAPDEELQIAKEIVKSTLQV